MSSNNLSKTARVTLLPSAKQFDVLPNRSILDSGLSAGLALPYGCANGSCGECRARIRHGKVQKHGHHDFTLTETEKLDGVCLLCCTTALTDCQIEVIEARSVADIAHQTLPARMCHLDKLESSLIVTFKFSRGKAMRFLPGQQVNLTYPDGFSITLPVASCPCNAQALEFHLTADTLNPALFEKLTTRVSSSSSRERIVVTGPLGCFTLGENIRAPKLFIVTGGEFAQVQGMIEQVFNLELQTPCCLIWSTSPLTNQYRHNLCRSWQDAFDEFDYIPLDETEDLLSSLPASWSQHLATAEVYLGKLNEGLARSLYQRGVSRERLFHPASAPD